MTFNPNSPLTVSLALTAHRQAEQWRQQHSDPAKAKQSYLNALAIYAVTFYLDCLGFETAATSTQSWLMDSAALMVRNYGALECRPVLPGSPAMQIPPEVWRDRIGYVAVQLDESLRQATLLGFVPTVATAAIPLTQLRSLDELPTHLRQWQQATPPPVNLADWLRNVADASWQAIGEFFDPMLNPAQPAFEFRSDRAPATYVPAASAPIIRRGKALTLETPSTPIAIVLLVGLLPISEREIDIWVQVESTSQTQLPPPLKLRVVDDAGAEVMAAQARGSEAMQLQFTVTKGEQFGVQIELDHTRLTETFLT
ncbi:MAG: DUF1822 family protein [Leptolyngbyaceae cyanobacterium SL_7_1]|nr:DUF1822 family protein [Leptolyngbyaceae cyanobacterium SL_7_1]